MRRIVRRWYPGSKSRQILHAVCIVKLARPGIEWKKIDTNGKIPRVTTAQKNLLWKWVSSICYKRSFSVVNIFKTVTKNLVFSPTNQAGGFGLFSYHLMAFVFLTGFMNGVNYYAQGNSISRWIQLWNFALKRLLNKPYENEVTLTGQNPPLNCC